MADTTLATFACEGCGKQYAWKPELAGRAVKCRCGAVMRAPAEPPAPDDDLYGMTDQPTSAPSPVSAPAAAAPSSPMSPASLRPAPAEVLQYAGKIPAPADQFDTDKLKNLHAPLALIAAGFVVLCIATWWQAGTQGLMPAFTVMGILLAIRTTLMLIAVFFVSRQRGFKVGSLGSAILKLLAISLGPVAVMAVLSLPLDFVPLGFVANWLIGLCLYFALIGYFFDLDQEDTWACVWVIFLVNLAVSLVVRFWL